MNGLYPAIIEVDESYKILVVVDNQENSNQNMNKCGHLLPPSLKSSDLAVEGLEVKHEDFTLNIQCVLEGPMIEVPDITKLPTTVSFYHSPSKDLLNPKPFGQLTIAEIPGFENKIGS